MRDEFEWLIKLTKADDLDKKRILNLHQLIFGNSINICINCPDSLRAAVNRLKVEYKNRYE